MECLMAGCFARAPMVGHVCPTFPEGLSTTRCVWTNHDEVAYGDPGREEAGHRSRWIVIYVDGRVEAGTGRNSGKRPQRGQKVVLCRPACHGGASGFSQGRAAWHQSDLSNNLP